MQLRTKRRPRVRKHLAAISASLLAATVAGLSGEASAQQFDGPYGESSAAFGPGDAYTDLESALLVYQESGGRVLAVEPSLDLSAHGAHGEVLTLGIVADAVSGATPNGAVPSDLTQVFITPVKAQGSTATVTSASGGSTIVHIPPTPGQVASAALGRQYLAAPDSLPVDKGFHDHRGAINFGWSQPLGGITEIGFGGSYSHEQDYQAISANARVAQTFNSSNTTLSLQFDTEIDSSFPFGGVPKPLTAMSPDWKTPSTRGKSQLGVTLGLTEVISRNWLLQLNYSYDAQNGYQNDPYRILSLVNGTSGEPTGYLYESRPGKRASQSVYLDNKFDFGSTVTELSLRYFTDDWGVSSKTAELSERIALGRIFYLEPSVRWYQQTAANFFHNFLVAGQALPAFASSDTRLSNFSSLNYGLKAGFILTPRTEFYVRGGYYSQMGDRHPADAVGQLKLQNLFAGTNAAVVFVGYSWDFH